MSTAVTLGVVVLSIFFLKAGSSLLVPLTLAFLIAFLLTLPVRILVARGLPRVLAVILVELCLLSFVGGLFWFEAVQISDFTAQSPQISEQLERKLVSLKESAGDYAQRIESALRPRTPPPLRPQASTKAVEPAPFDLHTFLSPLLSVLQSVGALVADLAFTLLLVFVLSFFFLFSWDELADRIFLLAGEERLVTTMLMLQEAATGVRRFVMLNCFVNLLFGLAMSAILAAFSIPQPLLWASIIALLRFVPSVGIIIGMLPPLLLSVATSDSAAPAVALAAVVAVFDLAMSNFVEPLIYGSRIGVSPVAIMLSAVFWTWCWGPIGLIIAPPLTVCLVVLGRYVPSLRFFTVLFGESTGSEVSYRFFHRLLSSSENEGREMLALQRKSVNDLELFDALILPALTIAELERGRRTLSEESYGVVLDRVAKLLDEMAAEKEPGEPAKAGSEETILIVPLRTRAELLCGEMLRRMLNEQGLPATLVSETALLGETLETIKATQPPVVLFSAISEVNGTSLRYLSKRLAAAGRGPSRFLLGRWNGNRLGPARVYTGAGELEEVNTIRDAVLRIADIQQVPQALAASVSDAGKLAA